MLFSNLHIKPFFALTDRWNLFSFLLQTSLINPLLIIQHTRFEITVWARADEALGVMRLYQKDLAEQC